MEQICPICENPFKVYSSQKRTYCSVTCMKVGYASRMIGAANPNFRHGLRQCAICGKNLARHTKGKNCQKCQFLIPGYKNHFTGKSHSEKTRKKMSENHSDNTGYRNPFYGRCHSQSVKNTISTKAKFRWQELPSDKKEQIRELLVRQAHVQQELRWTEPERKIAKWLSSLGISYQHNALLYNKFFVDFLLSNSCVIEVFGDYWHGNADVFPSLNNTQQRQKAKDKSRMAYLTKCGHRFIVLWEKNIKDGTFKSNPELRDALKNLIVRVPVISGFPVSTSNT